jgi:hypothetical protein
MHAIVAVMLAPTALRAMRESLEYRTCAFRRNGHGIVIEHPAGSELLLAG